MSLKLIKGIDNFPGYDDRTVATIGTFDGLHLGHQAILRRLKMSADKMGMNSLAITFEPHPRVLVTPGSPPLLLTCLDEKVSLFERYMDGTLLVLDFTPELMNLTAEEFTRKYLVERINLAKLIVGYDHAFGKGRSGTINDLMDLSRKYSFELEIVDPVIVNGRPISSTRIRQLMMGRNLTQAIKFLGHPYPLRGKVIGGIGLGKKLGFPTANLECNPRKLLPADGVYSCSIEHAGRNHDGMMFIGKNHFNPQADKSVEINIFNFDEEIYGEKVTCYPEVFVRENRKYTDTGDLVEQIKQDKKKILMLKK